MVYCSSVALRNACLSPSGLVPEDGAGDCGGELAFVDGGEGHDGVLQLLLRVLLAKVQDCNVIFFYFEVLYVICKLTDHV
jgi:hypothetical protein